MRRLLSPLPELRSAFSGVRFMGPAGIDFELPYVAAALDCLPAGSAFDALSHHLYVDRRGAPENRQGRFDTLRKCALTRAVAAASPAAADRVVVSEVNWPLRDTGVYSPVNSPYDTPGPRRNDPSVTEEEYARYMIRYLLIALTSGLVDRVYWWRLAAHGFGLMDDRVEPWRRRPAFAALATFLGVLGDATFTAYQSPEQHIHFYTFTQPDGRKVAVGYTTGATAPTAFPFPAEAVLDGDGHAVPITSEALQLTGAPQYVFAGIPSPHESV
jgi:hypothetical protein